MASRGSFDRVADRYDETRGGEERGRAVAAHLAPHLPPGELIELGVGTGLIAVAFADRGWRVTGFDIAPAMLARAAARVPGRLVLGNVSALPVRDATVDAALAVHVLHLVDEPGAVLSEVARALRPGGRLAVVGTGQPEASDISDLIGPMARALVGDRPRTDEPAVLAPLAGPVGLTLVEDLELRTPAPPTTPTAAARLVEDRLWSSLWDVPADQWARVVEPAIGALRRLPNPDQPRPGIVVVQTLIFEKDPVRTGRV